MSISINSVVIGGNLTRDPELRYTAQGAAVCDINVAVNKSWTDKKTGQKKDEVAFIEVTCWARTAEIAAEYLKKGSPVIVEGELKQDRWESQDGKKNSKTKVQANKVHLVGGMQGKQEPLVVPDDTQVPHDVTNKAEDEIGA